MKFTNPAFLFALFSLAIPVIIHLFNFRKFKRVYFTNVRFLKEVKQETSSRNKLRHLLVLASRMLALAFLVFAFSGPFIPVEKTKVQTGTKAISIYLDNSFSMEAENNNGKLFDQARKSAREIAGAYKSTDLFQLVTNDFEGKHQRLVNREEFLEILDEVKLSSNVKSLPDVISRQRDILNPASVNPGNRRSFLISDFQKSSAQPDQIKNDTTVNFTFIPVSANEQSNVYIDSVWFVSPVRRLNVPEELNIRLVNASNNELTDVPVRLFINNQQKTPAKLDLKPNSSIDTVITFTTRESGIQQGRIEITDSPVVFDDQFYFSWKISENIPVMVITSGEKETEISQDQSLRGLFGMDSLFRFTTVSESRIDLSNLKNQRLIILDGLKNMTTGLSHDLRDFVTNGGSLMVFPHNKSDLPGYKTFLSSLGTNYFTTLDTVNQKADKVSYDHELFKDVFEKRDANIDLPSTFSHYVVSRSTRSGEENLLRLRNGDPLISVYPSGKGKVYLSSVSLDPEFSNLTSHSLFVVTLYQAALFSQPETKLYYTIGNEEVIELSNVDLQGEKIFHIKSDEDPQFEIIPESRTIGSRTEIFQKNQIKTSGNYKIIHNNDSLAGVSFNYDRTESEQEFFSATDLTEMKNSRGLLNFNLVKPGEKEFSTLLAEMDEGIKLWKSCLILALIFLLFETLILRFWNPGTSVKTGKSQESTGT